MTAQIAPGTRRLGLLDNRNALTAPSLFLPSDDDEIPDIASYDHIVIACSFGKDSIGCHLRLLDMGADPSVIEWWHHDVDDAEASGRFLDWPSSLPYGRAVAAHLGVPLYLSGRRGGLRGEMMRENAPTAGVWFEMPGDEVGTAGGKSKNLATRRMYPQLSARLSVRYCSPYAKIMVGEAALAGQKRFHNSRTLFVTGERGTESQNRARYNTFKPHKVDARNSVALRRHIDHYMPVHKQTEAETWARMEKAGIMPAIPYRLGFSRLSCAGCIFNGADAFATLDMIWPALIETMTRDEKDFGCTIKRDMDLRSLINRGKPFAAALANPDLCAAALLDEYHGPVFTDNWTLPAGAFGRSGGPGEQDRRNERPTGDPR